MTEALRAHKPGDGRRGGRARRRRHTLRVTFPAGRLNGGTDGDRVAALRGAFP
jgi:hypothetical protein